MQQGEQKKLVVARTSSLSKMSNILLEQKNISHLWLSFHGNYKGNGISFDFAKKIQSNLGNSFTIIAPKEDINSPAKVRERKVTFQNLSCVDVTVKCPEEGK